jgi:hypothetical protein
LSLTKETKALTNVFFIGVVLSSTLKATFSSSSAWKEKVAGIQTDKLVSIRIEGAEYLGFYVMHSSLTLDEVHAHSQQLRSLLKTYCTESNMDELDIEIIAQLFVS